MKRTLAHRIARLVVRVGAWRAPLELRDRMASEWRAELEREFARGGGWGVTISALGVFADAAALRDVSRHGSEEMTMGERWAGVRGDAMFAVRGLMRAPSFTAIAVVTLGIGLGSSAGIYTLLDRVVLDPLPYPDSDRLVRLHNQVPGVGADEIWSLSTAQYVYFTDHATTLDAVGLYRGEGANIVTPSGPLRARTVLVTASMMSLLGAEARFGRLITAADDEPSGPPIALLSHGFWVRALGSDPEVVGTTIPLDDVPTEVIGVLEPGLDPPGWPAADAPDVWMPMRLSRSSGFSNSHVFPAIGHLATEATPEAVEAELARFTPRLPEEFPNVYSERFFDQYGFRTAALPLKNDVVGDLARNLWILFGGVGLVLLIACANVANLFLVRMEGRRREIGIRAALGADRGAVTRYVVSESMVLALAGGAVGLLVGWRAVPVLASLAPADLPRIHGVTMGAESIVFTIGVALAVGVGIALPPLAGSTTAVSSLGEGGRGSSTSRGRHRVRSAIVVSQMALAVTLIVGAGLLVESLRVLQRTDTGMDPSGVLAVDLYVNPQRHPTDVDLWAVYSQILDRVRALPGVISAGMGQQLPVEGGYGCTVQGFEDQSIYDRVREAGMTTCAGQTQVTPGYFETLGVPTLEGRAIEEGDLTDPTRAAVVVSRAFADRFWPGEDILGRGLGPSGRTEAPFYHIVGVVGDVAKRPDEGLPPLSQQAIAVYYPVVYNPEASGNWGRWWAGTMRLVVRTDSGDPVALVPAVRGVVSEIDPEIPLVNARSMVSLVAAATSEVSFISLLLAIAAGVALTLAAVGLYGVVAYVVSRRTREIGMRLAIGAEPREVVRGVVGGTLRLVAGGLTLGIPLAVFTSRVGRGLLVGVEPTEPGAYVASAILVGVVALLATWVPARRAARVDPVEALRAD
jgi:predicted permease